MMKYFLENENIKISTDTFGGELNNLFSKKNSIEYLWNGNEAYWKYHSPILFPIVGKVKDGKYIVDNKEYELPQHGLARTREFNMIEKDDNHIVFELLWSEDILKVYPYKFLLKSNYKLEGNTVKVTYTVENVDDKKIYFSIGSHPAFLCPIDRKDNLIDCYIEFNERETSKRIVINNEGYLSRTKIDCLENTNKINLSKELFKDDALVFNDLKSNKITIKSNNNDKYLEVDFTGFPDMGIWAPKDGAPFVCIEPWFGHADYEDFNGDFKDKEGINKLAVGKSFKAAYLVTVQ